MSEIVADGVAQITGRVTSQRLLVMTEKNLSHANSVKHRKGGVGLSEKTIARCPELLLMRIWLFLIKAKDITI